MAEQTLNNPLAGNEIIEAILDKVRAKLRSDCFLNANSAYDWFNADISYKIDMHDSGALVKVDQQVIVSNGAMPETPDLQHVEAEFHIDPAPPNEVRVETGQPVPTLTKDEHGKDVIKGVRYARKDAKKAK